MQFIEKVWLFIWVIPASIFFLLFLGCISLMRGDQFVERVIDAITEVE